MTPHEIMVLPDIHVVHVLSNPNAVRLQIRELSG